MFFELFVAFFAVIPFCIVGLYGYYSEKKAWNKGICSQTKSPWQYFDTDSQGGRGYKSGQYVIWISYPYIDKEYFSS